MYRSELAIAALATVAIPGLDIYQARSAHAPEGYEAAYALDSEARQWLVRVPLTVAAGAALEAESAFLKEIEPFVNSGALPFVVPQPAGVAPLVEGGRAVVYPRIAGNALDIHALRPGPGAAASLGRAIGALHSLPVGIVENSGFPSYSAEQYRERRLAELDEGAASGLVPVPLLRRWETALENVALWRFAPVITHTSLSEDSVIMSHGQVGGITDWSHVQVGDPADDLAWLVATAPVEAVDSIIEAYQLRRAESLDKHLIDRAMLGSELALLKWLLHGIRLEDNEIIEDARSMLNDLLAATVDDTHTGSFTVSSLPAPRDRMPVERMIGDTSNVPVATSLGGLEETEITSQRPVVSADEASQVGTNHSGSVNLESVMPDSEVSTSGVTQSGEFETPEALGTDSEFAGDANELADERPVVAEDTDYELPDYSHARPPKPSADEHTQMLEALPHEDAKDIERS